MFSLAFGKRLLEEAVYAAIGGFATAMLTGELDKAGAVVGLMAAGRAVLGVLVVRFGAKDSPSVGG